MSFLALMALLGALVATDARSHEVAGVKLSDSMTPSEGVTLKLNGAGIRKKFVVKVYIGALYLEQRLNEAGAVITDPGHKLFRMHFLYKLVSSEKLANGWKEGFEANQTKEQFAALSGRLSEFNGCFPDAKKDDVIDILFTRDGVTQVSVNGKVSCRISGQDFQQAVLKVWLGEKPADTDLKKGLLTPPS